MITNDNYHMGRVDNTESIMAQAHFFLDRLAQVRLDLNSIIAQKNELKSKIKKAIQDRDSTYDIFKAEITSLSPDLSTKSVKELLELSKHDARLISWYNKYAKDMRLLNSHVQYLVGRYQGLIKQIQSIEAEQEQILDAYVAFASRTEVPVPTLEEVESRVVAPLPSSIDEDVKIIEEASILNELNPDTQNAVLLQQAEGQVVDELTKQVPVEVAQSGMGKVWTVAGILALAYIFIGG